VLARWKEHFEELLNDGSKSEQPAGPVDLRDNGVDIDLPSREDIYMTRIYFLFVKKALFQILGSRLF
jgi:hypothetical protein